MKKEYIIIPVVVIICFISLIAALYFNNKKNNNNQIPDNYISIFCGMDKDKEYRTYIYKMDNDKSNYGYEYINAEKKINEVQYQITSKGTVDWTDDCFNIAEENNAYDYVLLPKDSKKYTISEYHDTFLTN